MTDPKPPKPPRNRRPRRTRILRPREQRGLVGVARLQRVSAAIGLLVRLKPRAGRRPQYEILHAPTGRVLAVLAGVRAARQWIDGWTTARTLALAAAPRGVEIVRASLGYHKALDFED